MNPEPETMDSIIASGYKTIRGPVYNCGCERRGKRFFMCSYHEGFEAGLEAVRSVPGRVTP